MGGVKIAYKALQSLAQERKADVARHGSLSGLSYLPLAPSLSLSLPLPCAGCCMQCLLAPLSSSSLSLVFFSLPLSHRSINLSERFMCRERLYFSHTHAHTLSLSHTHTHERIHKHKDKERRLFFLAWGQNWCSIERKRAQELQLFTGDWVMSFVYR